MCSPRRRSVLSVRSEFERNLGIGWQRPPLRDELLGGGARTRELVVGDGSPGLTGVTHSLRVDFVGSQIVAETSHQKLDDVGFGRQAAARPGVPEVREIPAVGHEPVERVSEPEGGLDRKVGQVMRWEEATIFFRMPLPRHRPIRAFAAEDREAVDPIVNSNTHDDIA